MKELAPTLKDGFGRRWRNRTVFAGCGGTLRSALGAEGILKARRVSEAAA